MDHMGLDKKVKERWGQRGGLASEGATLEQDRQDLEEVQDYLDRHPNTSAHDIALCLHFGDGHAARLLKKAKERRLW
jgi:hypothetical protein